MFQPFCPQFDMTSFDTLGNGNTAELNLYGFRNVVRRAFSISVPWSDLLKAMPEYEGSMSMPNDNSQQLYEFSSEPGRTLDPNTSASVASFQPTSSTVNDFLKNRSNYIAINSLFSTCSPLTLEEFGQYEQDLQSLYCTLG